MTEKRPTLLHVVAFRDLSLELAAGTVDRHKSVNKFGRSTNVDSDTATDIWDGANPTDDEPIWIPPTAARIHTIVSDDTDDDGTLPGLGPGARTIQVYGLQDWDTAETSEVVVMNGTTGVPMSNAYVIIHRMKVLTKGATGPNVGVITATAASDGTVTAQINNAPEGQGQTQMAIYGVPSVQKAFMTAYYTSANRSASSGAVDVSLLVNPEPDAELLGYLVKHTQGLKPAGTSYIRHPFDPYFGISGPAIIKIQAMPTANNFDCSAGFDLIMVDNA